MKIIKLTIASLAILLLVEQVTAQTIELQKGLTRSHNINKPNIPFVEGLHVNSYSGGLFYERHDLYIPGRGPSIDITFFYNSTNTAIDLGFGKGWSMTYSMQCLPESNSVVIRHADGRKDTYTLNGTAYTAPLGIFDSLTEYQAGFFKLRTKYGTQYFFNDSTHHRVTSIADANGNTLTLTYTGSLPTSITDASGRSVTLTYTNGQLTQITDANTGPARSIHYMFDANGNPVTVTDPMGNSLHYEYDAVHNMTKVIDQLTNPFTISYLNCATVQTLTSPLNSMSFRFDTNLLTTTDSMLVDGVWQATSFKFDTLGNILEKMGNCCGYHLQYVYDTQKNVIQKTDAKDNIYTYQYDAKGNMTLETDPLSHTTVNAYEPVFNKVISTIDKNGNTSTYSYDANGNLTQINKPLGITESSTYNAFGLMTSHTDGRGFTKQYQYNAHGDLTMLTYTDSSTNTFTYNNVGFKLSETNALGYTTIYTYDLLNRMTQMKDALGNITTYLYDAKSNKISETNALGQVSSYVYDALGRKMSTTTTAGTESQTYNQRGITLSATDRNGNVRNYTYNTQNLVITETDPLLHSRNFTYDANGNKLTQTDYMGNLTSYTYDSVNRIKSVTDALSNVVLYGYDHNGNRTTITNALNNTTIYVYDALDRLIQIQHPMGTSVFTYDANGNKTSSTNANGHVSTYTYNNRDRKIAETDALNHSETMIYNAEGDLLSSTDKNGLITTYTYDSLRRKLSETIPGGETISYTYDAIGRILTKVLPTGNTITYTYNSANRVSGISDLMGVIKTFTYDANGNRLTQSDALGHTTSFTYNALNKNTSATDALAHTKMFTYNNNSNIISEQDMNGNTTLYTYDALNRRIGMTSPGGNTTTLTYNASGNLLSVTDANMRTTSYSYDANGRRVSETFADGTTKLNTYNAGGNLISSTDNNAVLTSYSYDAENRITLKNFPGSNDDVYTFDSGGRLLTANNSNATIAFTYDSAGRIASETLNGKTTSYTYNTAARKRTVTYPGGRVVEETYDQRIRPSSIVQPTTPSDNPSPSISFASYNYNNANQTLSLNRNNGVSTNFTYNNNNWVSSMNHTGSSNLAQFNYTFDNSGNILSEEKVHHANHSEKHTYTVEDQLSNYKEGTLTAGGDIPFPITQTQYNWDGVGNRTSIVNTTQTIPLANNYVFTQSVGAGLDPMIGATQILNPNNDNNLTPAINIGFPFIYEGVPYNTFSMSPDGFIKLGTGATQEPNNVITNTLNRPKLMAMWDNLATGTTGNGKMKMTGPQGNRILILQWFVTIPRNVAGPANSTFQIWLYETNGVIEFRYGIGNATTTGATVGINSGAGNPSNFISVTTLSNTADIAVPNNANNTWPGNSRKYTFTPIFNVTTTTNYTTNVVNKYTAINTIIPLYDANGNTLNDGTHSYQYDTENKLIAVDNGLTAVYKYDALGRRIQKITPAATINYYYDYQNIIEERNAADSVMATYVYGPKVDDILSMRRGGIDYFYHLNSLGSVIAVTDNTGAVVERYEYDAYGTPSIYDTSFVIRASTLIGNPYLFTAREYNPETGHYHYRARSYNPLWGRFDQWDPKGFVDGVNRYKFSGNNPHTRKDPCGEDDIRVNDGVVSYNPEGFMGWDQTPTDIGTVDENGVVHFNPELGLDDMPLDDLEDLGSADSYDELITDIKEKQKEANGSDDAYQSGDNVADYYRFRVTKEKCSADAAAAELLCRTQINARVGLYTGSEFQWMLIEGSISLCLEAAGVSIGFTPIGWALILIGTVPGVMAGKDIKDIFDKGKVAEAAIKLYCDCKNFR